MQFRQRRMRVLVDHLHRRAGDVRLPPHQELVEDDPDAVDVAARVGVAAMALLRAHVVRRAEYLAVVRQRRIELDVLGQPVVDQRDRRLVAQHHVAGLQVAVQHARVVQHLERLRHLPEERQRAQRRDGLLDAAAQVAERKVLHRDEGMVVGDAEVVHARDVRVLDRRRDLVFAQEAVEVAHARALVRRLVQHLERDLGAGALALGEVHARHRALGELADVAEAADGGVAEARGARRTRRRAPRAASTGRAARARRAAPRPGRHGRPCRATGRPAPRHGSRLPPFPATGAPSGRRSAGSRCGGSGRAASRRRTRARPCRRGARRRRRCPRSPPAGDRGRPARTRRRTDCRMR